MVARLPGSLQEGLRKLCLTSMSGEVERLRKDPGARQLTPEAFLEHLVQHELQARQSRATERRLHLAAFPEVLRLEDYDFGRMPKLDERFIRELHQGEWIRRGDNVVFCGGSGLGKTHLATSIGQEACERGYRVLFKKVDLLVLELLEAREETRLLALRRKLQRVDLLILDELGYTPFDRAGGELLHGVISERYEGHKALLVTTNLEFGRWVEVFQSKEMTIALLDRLTHRCDVIMMTGSSKRREDSLSRQQSRLGKAGGKVAHS